MSQKIVLLDGYSLIYRAYHALSAPMNAPDGTPTNAIHGFMMMALKIIDEERPDALAVAFDTHAPTFRKEMYDGYKATRKPMPDDLRAQDPVIRELIGQMGIAILEKKGWEADDILGTVSKKCEDTGDTALLVTGDRDSFQLSGPRTTIIYTRRGASDVTRVTPAYIRENYGIEPAQFIDVKALMGDSSDNIPGIPGIGEKTALKLIIQYGSLSEALDRAEAEQKGKLRERLMGGRELAELSYRLARIDRNAPIPFTPEAWKLGNIMNAMPRLRSLGMNQVARRLTEVAGRLNTGDTPEAPAPVETEELPEIELFQERAALEQRIMALAGSARWAAVHVGALFTVETDSARLSMPLGGDLLSPGLSDGEAWAAALPLIRSNCPKYLHDIKSMPVDLSDIHGDITDVMLAAYALNPQRPGFDLEGLCLQSGIEGFNAHPATALRRLAKTQRQQMEDTGVAAIYRDIELPLAYVLRDMEREGFLVDASVLQDLGKDFKVHIDALTGEITEMAGEKVNINSPKQLGELLFNKLGIPSPTKKISTRAEVLEQLADEYPICAKLLEYRKYQKLQSTYIDALIPMRDENGRIHTRFDPVGTATGRISSSEPNLQNIPVRTELGKAIRGAFIARPGWVLVTRTTARSSFGCWPTSPATPP